MRRFNGIVNDLTKQAIADRPVHTDPVGVSDESTDDEIGGDLLLCP